MAFWGKTLLREGDGGKMPKSLCDTRSPGPNQKRQSGATVIKRKLTTGYKRGEKKAGNFLRKNQNGKSREKAGGKHFTWILDVDTTPKSAYAKGEKVEEHALFRLPLAGRSCT